MPKDAVDWYVGFLKKVYDTPEFKDYLHKGALKPAFATGRRVREVGGGRRAAAPGADDEGRAAQEVDAASPISSPPSLLMLLGGRRARRRRPPRHRLGHATGPQSGFFPFWLAVLLIGACAAIVVQALRCARPAKPFVTARAARARC